MTNSEPVVVSDRLRWTTTEGNVNLDSTLRSSGDKDCEGSVLGFVEMASPELPAREPESRSGGRRYRSYCHRSYRHRGRSHQGRRLRADLVGRNLPQDEPVHLDSSDGHHGSRSHGSLGGVE